MSVNQLVPIITSGGIQSSMSLEAIAGALNLSINELYKQMMTASSPAFNIADIATVFQVNNGTGNYGFLGDVPGLKEWTSTKTYGQMKKYDYKLINKEYYDAIAFGKRELRQSGLINLPQRVAQLAEAVMIFKKELILNALVSGDTLLAYDGVAFFSDVSGLRVNDNLLAGTGVTLATITADVLSARATAKAFKSDTGRYIRGNLDTVVCPVALEALFLQLKNSTSDPNLANSNASRTAGSYIKNVIADPILDADDATDWYFLDSSRSVKPLVLQTELMNNGSDIETVEDITKWASDGIIGVSVEAAMSAGYGHPATAVKVVNSGS